jgi:hypothetical protein
MSIQSFAGYFFQQTGEDLSVLDSTTTSTEGLFASNCTNWLDDVVLADSDVKTWL